MYDRSNRLQSSLMQRKLIEAKELARHTKTLASEITDIGLNVGVGAVNAAQAGWFIVRGKASRERINTLKTTIPVLRDVAALSSRSRHSHAMETIDAAYHVGDQNHSPDFAIAVNEVVFDASSRINRSFRQKAFENWIKAAKRLIGW